MFKCMPGHPHFTAYLQRCWNNNHPALAATTISAISLERMPYAGNKYHHWQHTICRSHIYIITFYDDFYGYLYNKNDLLNQFCVCAHLISFKAPLFA